MREFAIIPLRTLRHMTAEYPHVDEDTARLKARYVFF